MNFTFDIETLELFTESEGIGLEQLAELNKLSNLRKYAFWGAVVYARDNGEKEPTPEEFKRYWKTEANLGEISKLISDSMNDRLGNLMAVESR